MFCKQTNIGQELNVWLLGVADKACFVTHTRKISHIRQHTNHTQTRIKQGILSATIDRRLVSGKRVAQENN